MERVRRIFPFNKLGGLGGEVDPRLANQALATRYGLWAKRWEERAAAFLHRRALEECRLATLKSRRQNLQDPRGPVRGGDEPAATTAQLRTILEWEKGQRLEALERRIRASQARLERLREMAEVCLERAQGMEEMRRSILERP